MHNNSLNKTTDVPPMIFSGNPLILKPGMIFFMHMILMDSENQLAMNLGETYLVTEEVMRD